MAVVGGGLAGVAAAVTTAEAGARTLLIERSDILGGNAGNALVHTICGLYLPADGDAEAGYAHAGFPRRFADLLLRQGAARPAERAGRVWVLPTFPHRLAEVARELCESTSGLELSFDAPLLSASSVDDGFTLRVAGGSSIHTAIGVDASGDANLASLLGAECRAADASMLQNPSLIFRVRGVDPAETEGFARLRVSHAIADAERRLQLPAGAGSVLLRPGPEVGEAYVTLNVAKPCDRPFAPLDGQFLAALASEARGHAAALVAHLRAHRPGFASCEIVEWPRCIGVRETRRIAGIEEMTAEALLAGRRRADEVAISTWPIELWHDHKGARFTYPSGPSSIPLGALVSRDLPRLGMAGRCMSATHEALGALRVLGTAMATGEAIGRAAAQSVERSCTLADLVHARK